MTSKEQAMHWRNLAKKYHSFGFNIVPLGSDKRPVTTGVSSSGAPLRFKWSDWIETRQDDKLFAGVLGFAWWADVRGVAALGGPVSGNLLIFDGDHADIEVARQNLRLLGLPEGYEWLNPSGSGDGWHLYVKCSGWTQATASVRHEAVGGGVLETRWGGSYTALPGSCHPSGSIYPGEPAMPPREVAAAAAAEFLAAVTVATPRPAPRPAARPAADARQKYVDAALRSETAAVARAANGGRNAQLNRSAFALGTLVGAGALARHDAETELTAAALAAGLEQAEITATLRSGIDAGQAAPRDMSDVAQEQPLPPHPRQVRGVAAGWWSGRAPHEYDLRCAFIELHGRDWLYAPDAKIWWRWQSTHWDSAKVEAVAAIMTTMQDGAFAAADAAAQAMMAAATDKEERQAAKAAKQEAAAWKTTSKRTSAAIEQCKSLLASTAPARRNVLNLANGTLDLSTYELQPHNRADLLTHCVAHEYDAAAQCPTWLRFISEVLVSESKQTDHELVALVQEAFGYSLTEQTNQEAFFFLSGSGSNGKSTLLRTLAALLGDDLSMTLALDTLTDYGSDYRLARLSGKRVVFSTESRTGGRVADGIFRQIASGETIDARPIGQAPVQIEPVCKLWWAQNSQPSVSDSSDGFWRRLRLIPFRRQFAEHERDIDLAAKLRTELPGILNWALAGLRRLRANGRFTVAQQATAAAAEYRQSSNPIALWRAECTVIVANRHPLTMALAEARVEKAAVRGWTLASDAFASYRAWCDASGIRACNQTVFGRELTAELARTSLAKERDRLNRPYYPFELGEAGFSADPLDFGV